MKSLKGLAAIRDAVWDLLSTDSISQHWSTVCQRLLEHPLAVWDDFLQQLFLQRLQVGAPLTSRLETQFSASELVCLMMNLHSLKMYGMFSLTVLTDLPADVLHILHIAKYSYGSSLPFCKAITKEETEAISTSSVTLLTSAVRDLEGQTIDTYSGIHLGSSRGAQYEVDVASFLWSESPGDLPGDAGWVSVSQRGQQHQRSSLAMKTQALTPCVQNFCSSMDAKLKARLDDLQHYLPSQDTGKGRAA